MKGIVKGKWWILAAWIMLLTYFFITAPKMENLVREKGQISVPQGYSSTLANKLLQDVQSNEKKGNELQTVLVFHSDKKLTTSDYENAKKAVKELENNKQKLGITELISHFQQADLKNQLVSKDGKTILVSLKVTANGRENKEILSDLYKTIDHVKLNHYYTGSWVIGEDLVSNSQEGLKKTEGITIVFILVVLLLVFRSAVAPFIPLITVGFSYLASQSIVAILVDKVNFPLSTFTQTFLVAVLFGIGTDYCILLLSRFKEELFETDDVTEAIIATYRTAGKTVIFSGIAVLIGFASIGLSTFQLYKSASAVAIGVAFLLLALLSIVPFFMAVLGKKLFWPAKGNLEHGESKIWGVFGKFSLTRPLIAFLIVAVMTVPFIFTYKGQLSFNSLEEISDKYASIKGFTIISKSFSPGESMPTQIVIKNDDKMDTSDYMTITEKITQELKKINNVQTVRSVTQPTGAVINDFYISKQAANVGDGLDQGNNGIQKISSGLDEMHNKLADSEPQLQNSTNGINKLITGTNQVKTGIGTIQTNLTKIKDGLTQGTMGAHKAQQGLEQIKTQSEKLLAGSKQLLDGYTQAGSGINDLLSYYNQVADGIDSLNKSLLNLNPNFSTLEKEYKGIAQNQNYQTIKMTVIGAQNGTATLSNSLKQLNTKLGGVKEGLNTANHQFDALISGQEALVKGMDELVSGLSKLETGLKSLENGQGQIIENMPKLSDGLSSVNNGQRQLLNGFQNLGGQISQLTDGLSQSSEGLNKVSDGLHSAQNYLADVSKQKHDGFYIPQNVIDGQDFQKSLDAYMSKDRKVMTIDVVFNKNPYSNAAIHSIPEIKDTVKRTVKGTKLENAQIAVGGVSSMNHDLDQISKDDYSRTVILMLAGISIILIILLRSFVMPLYLIGSLILTYYTAMSITEKIFVNWQGYSGISWAVPFFAFVMLIALGIDYSIFLMDRFNEYQHLPVQQAILQSMKKMGTVIISAAIILGGTFAAMMPSGVLSLLEIATILLIGLALYAFIILPLLIPVMVKTFGKAN
ncbi:MMPL family transporter [Neobacillus fumarioli]|uniref:MMPL family transporter n=1 Tax=Neobacillus fumarioli TaxID=105229 RepID=UPI000832B1BB|nr:MMPL family transporter [Neobacillus fumarioli]